jgi:hypothetical protein
MNSRSSSSNALDLDAFSSLEPVAERRVESLAPMSETTRATLYHLIGSVLCFFQDHLGTQLWATGGTLLGAIRHGDLIPHDDDADFGVRQSALTNWLQSSKHVKATLQQLFAPTTADAPNAVAAAAADVPAADAAKMQQVLPALLFLKSRGVAFCYSDTVGFKFFVVPPNGGSAAPLDLDTPVYPFLDVFVMRQLASFRLLREQYPTLARKLVQFRCVNRNDDTGDEQPQHDDDACAFDDQPVLILDSKVSREAWCNETFFCEAVEKTELVPFGPTLRVPIPRREAALDYLFRTYGSDCLRVVRSHNLDHVTGERLRVIEQPFE